LKLTKRQQEAFDKFSKLKVGALFMKQGTGKTRVAIELIHSTDCDFVLFLCPYSTKRNLLDEIEKWGLDKPFEVVGYETISSSDRKYLELMDLKSKYSKIFIVADEPAFGGLSSEKATNPYYRWCLSGERGMYHAFAPQYKAGIRFWQYDGGSELSSCVSV
jgi:hypothetical protein